MLSSLIAWIARAVGGRQPGVAHSADGSQTPVARASLRIAPAGSDAPIAAGAPVAASAPLTPAAFIAAIAPAARACATRAHVPASVTIAQAALESAWGAHAPGMNLFGIKADASWHGPVRSQVTHEVIDGQTVTVTARFRVYGDWQGSIDDHADFLARNPRYRSAFTCADGLSFADAIARAGYATDPQYAAKLKSIMVAHRLTAFDVCGVVA